MKSWGPYRMRMQRTVGTFLLSNKTHTRILKPITIFKKICCNDLYFSRHIIAVTKSAFFHLKNIFKFSDFMSRDNVKKKNHPCFWLPHPTYTHTNYSAAQQIQNGATRVQRQTGEVIILYSFWSPHTGCQWLKWFMILKYCC